MLGLNRELWLLFALNLAIGFANQFVQPLFPLFLSGLGASEVEELEMIHVAAPDELARLARRHDSCILLANAPRAMVTLQDQT